MHHIRVILLAGVSILALPCSVTVAVTPPGIVYESEAISTPETAWQLNKRTTDRWMLWTREADIEKKRSRKAVLASPTVSADRKSPDQGAPPLHSVVTDLKPGVYLVYVSGPGRPLAYSLDGKTWFRHQGGELSLGARHLPDGRFELWVDDAYAHPPGNPGPGYYDYLRFVPVPASALNVERDPCWYGLDRWLAEEGRGFAIPATKTQDWVGFETQGDGIRAGRSGDRFSYVLDRAGEYHLAVRMNDDVDGVEQLTVTLNDKEIGCIIGDQPRGGVFLYRIKQPLKVSPGDKLTFTCGSNVGFYRVQALYLSAEPIIPPPPSFEHVEAWCPEPGSVDLCWTTTTIVPTGTVTYGASGQPAKTVKSTYEGRSHRVRLRGLDATKTYQAKIATEHNGESMVSGPIPFRAVPKSPPATKPRKIALTVPEPTAHPRRRWPATIGMPLAKGALATTDDLALLDAQARRVPLQAEHFSRWHDGSVKWATLSFLADTQPPSAGSPARYVLQFGKVTAASKHDTATVDETDRAWRVRSDCLMLDIGKEGPGLFQVAAMDRNGDGKFADDERIDTGQRLTTLELTTGDGTTLCAGPPAPGRFEVESNGPVRAVLAWSGPFVTAKGLSPWRYLVRLTLWRGQPTIGVSASVWYDEPAHHFREVASLVLRVPLEARGSIRGGLEGQGPAPLPDAEGCWLRQDKDNHFRLRTANGTTQGKRATGVGVAVSDRSRLTVLIGDFWQTYPSGLAIRPDEVRAELLPPLHADTYSDPDSQKWFYRLYAWFKDGRYVLRSGQVTQHRVYLRWDTGGADDAGRFAALWSRPLLPHASPDYLCATGVLSRPIFPRTKGLWDLYEECFERGFASNLADRERRRTYGWMHYGDWFGERILNFGNSEYDLAWATGVQWMRTGDRRYFDRGLQMARHYSTVDTVRTSNADERHCIVWTHCFNHVGTNRTPQDLRMPPDDKDVQSYLERFRAFMRGVMDRQGHVYQPGNWLYAAMTGDRWLRHTAERVCTHQAEKLTPAFNFGIERSGGWPLINATAAYDFSGSPYYLNAARLMIERCLQRQDPATGGWLHRPPIGETNGVPVIGGKAFAAGILTYGILRYLDQEPLDRPDVRRMLVRGADWLMNESWNPGKGFRYISRAPNYRDGGRRGITCLLNAEVIAFAYEQTRDPKYLAFWREMMQGMLEQLKSGMGKSFTMTVRQTVYGLDRVRPFGITASPKADP